MADARRAYLIDENDTVAVALCPLHGGETVIAGGYTVRVSEDIPMGHKLAVRPIAAGEEIFKYGCPIGRATEDIAVGRHVHTHNMCTELAGTLHYTYIPAFRDLPPQPPAMFSGYRRRDPQRGVDYPDGGMCQRRCTGDRKCGTGILQPAYRRCVCL